MRVDTTDAANPAIQTYQLPPNYIIKRMALAGGVLFAANNYGVNAFAIPGSGGPTLTVSAKANIFGAGHPDWKIAGIPASGTMPPYFKVTGAAGSAVTFSGITGSNAGAYLGLLGGSVPLANATAMPLFLDPGSTITVSGTGGADVGAMSVNVTMPSGLVWTNRDQIGTVDRSAR